MDIIAINLFSDDDVSVSQRMIDETQQSQRSHLRKRLHVRLGMSPSSANRGREYTETVLEAPQRYSSGSIAIGKPVA